MIDLSPKQEDWPVLSCSFCTLVKPYLVFYMLYATYYKHMHSVQWCTL